MALDEELLSRQPPHSLEAEQSVLGSVLIDSQCVTEVIGILKPEDFYLQQNREIYEAIYTMFNYSQTIDPVTVLDKLREMTLTVTAKGGGAGRLFGSVTNQEIADALAKQSGIKLDKRKIVIADPIKSVGTYTVTCKLGYEISAPLTVKIEEA